ncbi:hypothetical protein BD309DRAFT_972056 [Dichomitus squalens]|nr:hypothetical protein BD309DRAFT_972056 [Dichomitus squalens]
MSMSPLQPCFQTRSCLGCRATDYSISKPFLLTGWTGRSLSRHHCTVRKVGPLHRSDVIHLRRYQTRSTLYPIVVIILSSPSLICVVPNLGTKGAPSLYS